MAESLSIANAVKYLPSAENFTYNLKYVLQKITLKLDHEKKDFVISQHGLFPVLQYYSISYC